jgi:DNA-binding MarR family transcriptional regulator
VPLDGIDPAVDAIMSSVAPYADRVLAAGAVMYLRQHGEASTAEIAAALNADPDDVQRVMEDFSTKGLVH